MATAEPVAGRLVPVRSERQAYAYRDDARLLMRRIAGCDSVFGLRDIRDSDREQWAADGCSVYGRPNAHIPRMLLHLRMDKGHKLATCFALTHQDTERYVWSLPVLAHRPLFEQPSVVSGYYIPECDTFFLDSAPIVSGTDTRKMGLSMGIASFMAQCDFIDTSTATRFAVVDYKAYNPLDPRPLLVYCNEHEPCVFIEHPIGPNDVRPDRGEPYDPVASGCASAAQAIIADVQQRDAYERARNSHVHPSRRIDRRDREAEETRTRSSTQETEGNRRSSRGRYDRDDSSRRHSRDRRNTRPRNG